MSWDSYIDNLLAQTKDASGTAHADKACIIGLDGSKWTTDGHQNHLKLELTEIPNITNAFKQNDFSGFQAKGVFVGGEKYQFLREEDGKIVFAKKKDHGALTLQKSQTAVVLGHTKEGSSQGNTNKGVSVIAEYLESLGM